MRVLFVGGGYVTVWAHRAMRRAIRRGDVTTTVVAPGLTHRFHGFTGEVLGDLLPPRRLVTDLAELCPAATLVDGTVTAVDLERRRATVRTADGVTEVEYDQLVLAAGSSDSRTPPGIGAHGYSAKDPAGFALLHRRLAQPWRDLVVVGGGLAGAELCAAIAERFRDDGRRIQLVHSGPALVPELLPRYRGLARYVHRQLDRYGVRVRTGTAVREVGPTGVALADGTLLPADLVVSTSGQRPVAVPGTEQLPRLPDGRLRVDAFLRVAGRPEVWSGGDLAAVPHIASGRPSPANALWAIKHGGRLGRNLVRQLRGRTPRRFGYPGLGRSACLGVGKGAAHLYGVPFTGWLAWFTRAVFFLAYMPSRRQARAAAGELLTAVRTRHRRPSPSTNPSTATSDPSLEQA
ncbi:NADH dehydrogenase [Virgisporangium aliadipatigenens]|uniref:NADH dehydrogenase n=1 Tax=Virgisporangium aliadipatigenens TaxID=741659 RepID=A0A8J4DMD7_9ACTN|nr:FAD-dependent oxidoreductase [Virgisporangium aliadipatigenens]GIJ43675.1 NADH dehydrogenase [Virgisporangium aliadipatigenens]